MNRLLKSTLAIVMVIALTFAFASCAGIGDNNGGSASKNSVSSADASHNADASKSDGSQSVSDSKGGDSQSVSDSKSDDSQSVSDSKGDDSQTTDSSQGGDDSKNPDDSDSSSSSDSSSGSDSSGSGTDGEMNAQKWSETFNSLYTLNNFTASEGNHVNMKLLYNGVEVTAETDLSAIQPGMTGEVLLQSFGGMTEVKTQYVYKVDFDAGKINEDYTQSGGGGSDETNKYRYRLDGTWIKQMRASSDYVNLYGPYPSEAEAKSAFRYYTDIANSIAATPIQMKKDGKTVQIDQAFDYFTLNAEGKYVAEIYVPEQAAEFGDDVEGTITITIAETGFRLDMDCTMNLEIPDVMYGPDKYLSEEELAEKNAMKEAFKGITIEAKLNYFDVIENFDKTVVEDDYDESSFTYVYPSYLVHSQANYTQAFEGFDFEHGYTVSFDDYYLGTVDTYTSIALKGNDNEFAAYVRVRNYDTNTVSGTYYLAKNGTLKTYTAVYNKDGRDDSEEHITAMQETATEQIEAGKTAAEAVLAKLPVQAGLLTKKYNGKNLSELYSEFHYECRDFCATLNDGEKDIDVAMHFNYSNSSSSDDPKDYSHVEFSLGTIEYGDIYASYSESAYYVERLNPETFEPYVPVVPYDQGKFSADVDKLQNLEGVKLFYENYHNYANDLSIEVRADFENNIMWVNSYGSESSEKLYLIEDGVLVVYEKQGDGLWVKSSAGSGIPAEQQFKNVILKMGDITLEEVIENVAYDGSNDKIFGLKNMHEYFNWTTTTSGMLEGCNYNGDWGTVMIEIDAQNDEISRITYDFSGVYAELQINEGVKDTSPLTELKDQILNDYQSQSNQ